MKSNKYPQPYTELNEEEAKIYARLWESVKSFIGIQDVDNFIITTVALKLNMAAEALGRIKNSESGQPIHQFENGTKQVSPDYTVFRTMSEEAAKLLEKAGLTPKARKDLLPDEEKTKPKDLMAELLGISENHKTVN